MMNCYDSRRVSRQMRQALQEFRDAGGVDGDVDPEVADGDGAAGMEGETLEQRVAALEEENRGLREVVEGQTRQLEELTRRVAALGSSQEPGDDAEVVDAADADAHDDDRVADIGQDWRPPRRRPGMPNRGVVTLEDQPDEQHAFGPAAPLVAEWRKLRIGGGQAASRVDRAQAAVRRWELEAAMLGEFYLTLPPETHPLDDAKRADHVRWRRDALAEARRELGLARRMQLLRRVLTLGLWQK